MTQNKGKYNFNRILSWLVVATLFVLLPFIYDTKLQDPELTSRFLIFSGLLSLLFILFLMRGKAILSSANKEWFTGWHTISFAVFLLIAGLSVCRSFDTAAAIYDWLRIASMFIFMLVFTFLLSNNYVKKQDLFVGVAIAVILFFLFELKIILPDLFNDLSHKKHFEIAFWYGSTLANKNMYCEALFMFLPILACGIISLKSYWKYLCITSFLIAFVSIFFLQTLSAIVAIVITGILLMIAVYRFKINAVSYQLTGKLKTRLIVSGILFLLGVVVLFIYTKNFYFIKIKSEMLYKFLTDKSSIGNSNKTYGSFSERILLWQHTLRMIKDYPLLGCGLSNWKTLLPHYGLFGIRYVDAGTLKYEHPHNDYLLLTAETGIIGLIAYLLIFFFVLKQALSNIKQSLAERSEALINLFTFLGIIGFMILSMFEFPKERFYPFLMLMILFSMVIKNTRVKNSGNKLPVSSVMPVLILCLGISLFSTWFFYKRLEGEVHFYKATQFQDNRDWLGMEKESVLAKSVAFKSDRLAIPMDWYAGFASFYRGDVSTARNYFQKAVQLNPYFMQGWNDLGTCYEQAKDFPQAIDCYKTALSINPTFNNAWLNLIAAYYNTGRRDTAYQIISNMSSQSANGQYKSYLTIMVRNKLNGDFDFLNDEEMKKRMEIKLKNNDYVYKLFFRAKNLNINIDSLFYKELKK